MVCGHKMGATTLRIMTLSIMTFSITIIKCDTQHNEKIQLSDRQSLNVANNLLLLSVFMLSVILQTVVMLKVIAPTKCQHKVTKGQIL
jgi:hypothetical protein